MNELPCLVFAGSASQSLAEKVCNSLGCSLGKVRTEHLANGEFTVFYEGSIRGKDIFLVQSAYPNADNIMKLLLTIGVAKRASAHYITVVIPCFRWAGQDRKDKPCVSIGAKLIADLLSVTGVTRLITMDPYTDQVQGFFNILVDHLYGSTVFTEYIEHNMPVENLCIATPDIGGTKRANSYARHFGVPMVVCHKRRAKANEVAEMTIISDVAGKGMILMDDIVDTAGMMTKAADLMLEHGAKSVRVFATHAVMNDPAAERADQSGLTEMIFTDSIPYSKKSEKIRIISIAKLFAESVRRVCSHGSTSSLYTF